MKSDGFSPVGETMSQIYLPESAILTLVSLSTSPTATLLGGNWAPTLDQRTSGCRPPRSVDTMQRNCIDEPTVVVCSRFSASTDAWKSGARF